MGFFKMAQETWKKVSYESHKFIFEYKINSFSMIGQNPVLLSIGPFGTNNKLQKKFLHSATSYSIFQYEENLGEPFYFYFQCDAIFAYLIIENFHTHTHMYMKRKGSEFNY